MRKSYWGKFVEKYANDETLSHVISVLNSDSASESECRSAIEELKENSVSTEALDVVQKRVDFITKKSKTWDGFKESLNNYPEDVQELVVEIDKIEANPSADKIKEMEQKIMQKHLEEDVESRFVKQLKTINRKILKQEPSAFGEFIRRVRTEKKLTLQQVSELTHLSASYINRIEQYSGFTPSIRVVDAIANAYEIKRDVLLSFLTTPTGESGENDEFDIYELMKYKKIKYDDFYFESRGEITAFMNIINELINAKKVKSMDSLRLLQLVDVFIKQ